MRNRFQRIPQAYVAWRGGPVRLIGSPYRPARLGIDSWEVFKFGLRVFCVLWGGRGVLIFKYLLYSLSGLGLMFMDKLNRLDGFIYSYLKKPWVNLNLETVSP